jgi:hypothetical protein
MQKDFPGWHRHKEQLHAQHQTPTFQEREIWWCSVGVNIGHEMDGKNQFSVTKLDQSHLSEIERLTESISKHPCRPRGITASSDELNRRNTFP